jgi:plasmid stabilization system protein ParE
MDRPVVWTLNAIQDQIEIYEYWFAVTGETGYIQTLDDSIRRAIHVIRRHPHAGSPLIGTPDRYMLVDSYQLIYRLGIQHIQILQIWDTRREPR